MGWAASSVVQSRSGADHSHLNIYRHNLTQLIIDTRVVKINRVQQGKDRVTMAVDLKKYAEDIREACSDVTSDKTDTDWAMFGYEGQTNVIKLMSSGDGGLEELTEDFNPSKIQYALLRVEDPKTSLAKFVLINWQGETAPGNRKGTCAMHLRDVENFIKGWLKYFIKI